MHRYTEKEEIHENIEINENVELEYEIKLPQFLIDFSNKTNQNEDKPVDQIMSIQSEIEEIEEIIEEFDEEDLLMEEKRNKEKKPQKENTISKNNLNIAISTPTPTPNNDNLTLIDHNISDSIDEESNIKEEQNVVFNKESEEEKIYNTKLNQYKSLFNEGKFNELEELIINSK